MATIENINTTVELENIIKNYVDIVNMACCDTIPHIKHKNKIDLPWWTDDLGALKREMTTKKRRVTCAAPSRRQHVVEVYLEAKRKYELEATKAQTESWKNFCGTQDRESLWDGIYRVIRRSSKKYEDQPLVENGVTLSPGDSVRLLAKTFFPQDLHTDDEPQHKETRRRAEWGVQGCQQGAVDPLFTMDELMQAARSFNHKKAPGADGLTADICLAAIETDKQVFLGLVNRCLDLSYFPIVWKEATVVVLRKPGKDDYTKPKSYRPIGLLPILGKVLEKMIIKRIRWHLSPNLNTRQYGFVPQRSTEDALYDLTQHLRKNLQGKMISVVISLDIEGAFDSAWWPAIQCGLAKKKCPLNLQMIARSYLSDRSVCVRYAGTECVVSTSKGCVQGSIGGPTFWNLLLDPLLDEITACNVHCQAFADDVVLVFSGFNIVEMEEQAGNVLRRVYEWGISNKLKFAPHKTSAMVVTNKLKYDAPRIYMGSTQIEVVKEIKILGLLMDNKLTFNNHLKEVCRKALNIYKPLARCAKMNWGLNSETIKTIYVAVIEPIIMYASSVWAPATEKLMTQKYLSTVQRGFAQKICKSYRTVSLNAALLLAGLMPLDLRIQETAKLYEAKRGIPQLMLRGREVERKTCFLKAPHPSEEVVVEFQCLENLEPRTIAEHKIAGLRIFTDGSKMDKGVGAALSCWQNGEETVNRKYRLESYCTIFQAEMHALLQATEIALKSTNRNVNVFSDSRSALEMLRGTETFHPLAFALKSNLRLLKAKETTIHFFWIRAHAGVDGNERADYLAKEAVLKLKSKPNYDKCPISFVKRCIRQETINRWNERYAHGQTASVTKTFLPSAELAYKTLKKVSLTPVLVQILTGHGGFAEYLHRFKCKDDPSCVCDPNVEETIIHMLIDCPQHSKAREDLQQNMQVNLCKNSLPEIFQNYKTRKPFLKYSIQIANTAITRNKT